MTSTVDPVVSALSRDLLPEAAAVAEVMAERIRERIPMYGEGGEVGHDELLATCTDNVRYILGSLAGEPVEVETPSSTGRRRAEQGVPYASVLEAFRVGARFLWELLVERADPEARHVLLLAAADIWSVSDDLAAQVTEAYRETLTELGRRDSQRRGVLVARLLEGSSKAAEDPGDSPEVLGVRQGDDLVVVSAESPTPGTEALPGIEALLRRRDVTSAWHLDTAHHEGLVRLRPGFGPDELVEVLGGLAQGRVGVSLQFTRLQATAEARREARLAATALTPGATGVLGYGDDTVGVLLAGAPESARDLVQRVLGPVLELPAHDCEVVLETARTWLQAAGSTSTAARRLHLHRNTVRYRLRRLEELTGRDLTHPVQAAELYLALEGVRILGLTRD